MWLISCYYLVVNSCPTLCNPMVRQAPLSMGFPRQEYWSGLPCPPPGDFSNPGIEPTAPALQVDFLLLSHLESLVKLSVQLSRSFVSDSLRPHESQHTRPPCPSPTSQSSLRLTFIESVMPSSHLILCHPLLLLPLIPPSIRVFSKTL